MKIKKRHQNQPDLFGPPQAPYVPEEDAPLTEDEWHQMYLDDLADGEEDDLTEPPLAPAGGTP